jgi:hypothetical protein
VRWGDGDFNYDGVLDILDATDLLVADLFDAGPYAVSAEAGSIAAVPEPASEPLLLAACAVAAALGGRRLRG